MAGKKGPTFGTIFENFVFTKSPCCPVDEHFYTDANAIAAAVSALNPVEFSYSGTPLYINLGAVPFSKIVGMPSYLLTSSPAGSITNTDISNWNTAVTSGFYTADSTVSGNRTVDVASNQLIWNNVGLFRIKEGNTTTGGTYDFNNGVDLLAYNATNSSNLILDPIGGLTFSFVNVATTSIISSLLVNNTGIKATGIVEYADNTTAIGAGLSAGYLYRTGDTLKIVH